ncbi:MAG: acyltransferase family protein [Arachnia sp.]
MPSPSSRVYALDAIRGFAIVAMVIAHTAPFIRSTVGRVVTYPEAILNDVAAPLFAMLIGATMALTTGRIGADPAAKRSYRIQTAIRAAILIGLGLLLDLVFSGVHIVLDVLGVTMLAALPFLFLRSRTLLVLGSVLLLAGPLFVAAFRALVAAQPDWFFPPNVLTKIVSWIALDQSYRLVGLLPLFLIGIVLGRSLIDKRRLPVPAMVTAAVLVFGAAEAWRFLGGPGTDVRGGYYEVLRDCAMAVGAFAVIAYLTDLASSRVQAVARRLMAPLAVQGTMALSIYVLHVVVLMALYNDVVAPGFAMAALAGTTKAGWLVQIGLVLFCWLFALAWRRWLGVGPIERLMGVVTGRYPLSSLWSTGRTSAPRAAAS